MSKMLKIWKFGLFSKVRHASEFKFCFLPAGRMESVWINLSIVGAAVPRALVGIFPA